MKRLILMALAFVIIAGCLKPEDFQIKNVRAEEWKSSWALPIVNSKLNLGDLVTRFDNYNPLKKDSTGFFTLLYESDDVNFNAGTHFKISNQTFSTGDIFPPGVTGTSSFSGSINSSKNGDFTYTGSNGEKLEILKLKSGTLQVVLNSSFQHNLQYTLTFPHLKKAGVALVITDAINHPTQTSTKNIDLSGYDADLTAGVSGQFNLFSYQIAYGITGTGNPISTSDKIEATVSLSNIGYSYVDGYLGNYDISIPPSIAEIELFDNSISSSIIFEDPRINVIITNSLGAPSTATLQTLSAENRDGNTANFTGTILNNPFTINAPTISELGQRKTTKFVINKSNSNIQSVMAITPNKVRFSGKLTINPSGNTGAKNFMTDTSVLKLKIETELPCWFKTSGIKLQDTIEFSLPNPDTNVVSLVKIKLMTENAFPIYAGVQAYFADASYKIIDSLIVPPHDIIAEAPVNASGYVTGSTNDYSEITMEKARYDIISATSKYIIIKGLIKNSGGVAQNVRITDANYLGLKISLYADVLIKY